MEELARLKAKLEIAERKLFKKDLELLILKNNEYNHIEFEKIDEDGIDMLMIVAAKLGDDGIKKYWLNSSKPRLLSRGFNVQRVFLFRLVSIRNPIN